MSFYKDQASGFRKPTRSIARNTDPATSHQAETHMRDSGKLDGQMAEVYELVRAHPHCTAFELTDYTNLDRYQIQRRLSDLAEAKKVKASATGRKCAKSGRMACTWDAIA